MRGSVQIVPGRGPGVLPLPNRQFPAGRVCAEEDCPTVLSIYTGGDRCWVHEPIRVYHVRGRHTTREREGSLA